MMSASSSPASSSSSSQLLQMQQQQQQQGSTSASSFNTSFSNCSVAVPISEDVLANAANIPEEEYFTRHPYKERCTFCDKDFETPASFHVHHPCFERSEFYLKNQGQDDPNGLHYLCKFCKRTFFERHLLKQHIRYHLPDRPFECNFCGHRFVCRPEVVAHVSSFHLKLKPFVCREPGCGKKYAEKFSLERHMDKNHGGKAFYQCKVCGEEFHWNSKWNKHKKTHPNYPEDEPTQAVDGNPLVCSFPGCGKKYSQKFMVGLHYEAVHLGKPRYKCDVCNKTFMFGQYLRDHKKRVGHFTESDGIVEGVSFMEGDDVEYLSGDEEATLEDMEEGMIEYFEQEIQQELSQGKGSSQQSMSGESKKHLAALLNEPPSSSSSFAFNDNHNQQQRVKNERFPGNNSSSFLEASLSGTRRGSSLLETALGPPVSSSTPLQLQLSGSQAYQNTHYAKSQQQQQQQQLSFASSSRTSLKSDAEVSSSSVGDDSLGDYIPSNFLEVILVENESSQPDEQNFDSTTTTTTSSSTTIMLPESSKGTSTSFFNALGLKGVVRKEEEEMLPGPDPSIPFVPKDIHVCSLCQGRFLSSILFAKHQEDHPLVITEEEEEELNNARNARQVLVPGKPSLIPAFNSTARKSLLAVVQPTKKEETTKSHPTVDVVSEEDNIDSTTNGFHAEDNASSSPPLESFAASKQLSPQEEEEEIEQVEMTPESYDDNNIVDKSHTVQQQTEYIVASEEIAFVSETKASQQQQQQQDLHETSINGGNKLNRNEGTGGIKRRRLSSTSSETHHQAQVGNNNDMNENSSQNNSSSSSANTSPGTPRRTSLRLTRVHHDYYKLTNPTIK